MAVKVEGLVVADTVHTQSTVDHQPWEVREEVFEP